MITDIIWLPYKLLNNTNTKFPLNIIEHFSKYGFVFIFENKKAEKILINVKKCFEKIDFMKS